MHVVIRKRLNEFAQKYPETRTALMQWYDKIKQNHFSSFMELKKMFPYADQVK
jgi:mRNA interferase HigB